VSSGIWAVTVIGPSTSELCGCLWRKGFDVSSHSGLELSTTAIKDVVDEVKRLINEDGGLFRGDIHSLEDDLVVLRNGYTLCFDGGYVDRAMIGTTSIDLKQPTVSLEFELRGAVLRWVMDELDDEDDDEEDGESEQHRDNSVLSWVLAILDRVDGDAIYHLQGEVPYLVRHGGELFLNEKYFSSPEDRAMVTQPYQLAHLEIPEDPEPPLHHYFVPPVLRRILGRRRGKQS
jgi:hypothetical protein